MAKKILLVSVVVLAVVGAAVFFLAREKQQKEQDREQAYAKSIKSIESLGYTIDPNEMKRRLADNAAPIYRSVAKEFESGGIVSDSWSKPGDRVTVLEALDKQKPEIYKTLARAAAKDRCDLGWDWSLGPEMRAPCGRSTKRL